MTSRLLRSDAINTSTKSKTIVGGSGKDPLLQKNEKVKSTDVSATVRGRSASRKSPIRPSSPPKSSSRKSAVSKSPSRKSPSRKSPSRKSPARKSPSRKSPSRRSPVRKSSSRKSPVRKSPVRKSSPIRKSPTLSTNIRKSSRSLKSIDDTLTFEKAKISGVLSVDTDSDSGDYEPPTSSEKPRATVRGRARKLSSDFVITKERHIPVLESDNYIRVVNRTSQKSLEKNSAQEIAIKKLTEFSDEDDIPLLRREKSKRPSEPRVVSRLTTPKEFGGWIGALLLIILQPLIFISLFLFCNESQCSFSKLPNLQKYKNVSTYLNYTSVLVYLGYISLLAFLSALPFGGRKVYSLPNKQGKLQYVMNGVFCAVVTSLVLIALEYFKVQIVSHVLNNYFQLTVSSLILAILFSFYLYVRSFFVSISALNPYAITNSRIYNFWIGREINPRLLGVLDLKLLQSRIFFVGMLLVNAIFIYKNVQFTTPIELNWSTLQGLKYNSTLLVITTLQIVYAFDFLLYESHATSTFDFQYEGLGYMSTLSTFMGLFLIAIIPKYVLDFKINLPYWQLALAVLIFSIGYTIMRGSLNQKHVFRLNPYSPSVIHLESIPTSLGKKLLVSGYWGVVRHPNYLGDILIIISFGVFTLNTPAIIVAIADIGFLIHRAHRDGKRCQERYGSSWNRYCQRVKYVLIPKIY